MKPRVLSKWETDKGNVEIWGLSNSIFRVDITKDCMNGDIYDLFTSDMMGRDNKLLSPDLTLQECYILAENHANKENIKQDY